MNQPAQPFPQNNVAQSHPWRSLLLVVLVGIVGLVDWFFWQGLSFSTPITLNSLNLDCREQHSPARLDHYEQPVHERVQLHLGYGVDAEHWEE